MRWPDLRSYDRTDAAGAPVVGEFERSYLGIRLVIGVLGLALPLLLVVVDAAFLDVEAAIRGSMSAYYHSPARDIFVGGLTATGVILISYLWWRWRTWDFWLSTAAGLAVVVVANFPTGRADVAASDSSCAQPAPDGSTCSAVQQTLGEHVVAIVHDVAAGSVVAAFAGICLVFALRDLGYGRAAKAGGQPLGVRAVWARIRGRRLAYLIHEAPRTLLFLGLLGGILLGAAWALAGPDWPAPRVYTGEFITFTCFGLAWLTAAWDLLRRTRLGRMTGLA